MSFHGFPIIDTANCHCGGGKSYTYQQPASSKPLLVPVQIAGSAQLAWHKYMKSNVAVKLLNYYTFRSALTRMVCGGNLRTYVHFPVSVTSTVCYIVRHSVRALAQLRTPADWSSDGIFCKSPGQSQEIVRVLRLLRNDRRPYGCFSFFGWFYVQMAIQIGFAINLSAKTNHWTALKHTETKTTQHAGGKHYCRFLFWDASPTPELNTLAPVLLPSNI